MTSIYVTGHRNPDTDSIVSAMAYASLRNVLGDRNFIPARLGELTDETKLVLDKFGFDPPLRLQNVRTQVRDLNFDTPPCIGTAVTISHAWHLLQGDIGSPSLPVVNEDGTLYGMLTASDIAACDMRFLNSTSVSGIPLFNLLSTLEGHLMNDVALDEITGDVGIVLSGDSVALDQLNPNSIILCGNQPDVIKAALDKKVCCIIVCASDIRQEHINNKNSCIISTPFDPYRAMRLLFQSISVGRICHTDNIALFHLDDYLDDVSELMLQSRYRSYPVLDENDKVAGTLSRFHLLRPRRKKVVLVDHNEISQSVWGLEQAEVLEIIDHHRLADVQTGNPIYFRNEPVGSTATIIAGMYQEKGIMPSSSLAGLLTAAIISDTIIFKSPTCTEKDIRMAQRMARIAGVSIDELGHSIFSASSSAEHSSEELLLSDFKEFRIAGHALGIGQVICIDSQELNNRIPDILDIMKQTKEKRGYDLIMLMLTDVLREGTLLLYIGDDETIRQAFNVSVSPNKVFLPGIMSRKKQIVPCLSLLWG